MNLHRRSDKRIMPTMPEKTMAEAAAEFGVGPVTVWTIKLAAEEHTLPSYWPSLRQAEQAGLIQPGWQRRAVLTPRGVQAVAAVCGGVTP